MQLPRSESAVRGAVSESGHWNDSTGRSRDIAMATPSHEKAVFLLSLKILGREGWIVDTLNMERVSPFSKGQLKN